MSSTLRLCLFIFPYHVISRTCEKIKNQAPPALYIYMSKTGHALILINKDEYFGRVVVPPFVVLETNVFS